MTGKAANEETAGVSGDDNHDTNLPKKRSHLSRPVPFCPSPRHFRPERRVAPDWRGSPPGPASLASVPCRSALCIPKLRRLNVHAVASRRKRPLSIDEAKEQTPTDKSSPSSKKVSHSDSRSLPASFEAPSVLCWPFCIRSNRPDGLQIKPDEPGPTVPAPSHTVTVTTTPAPTHTTSTQTHAAPTQTQTAPAPTHTALAPAPTRTDPRSNIFFYQESSSTAESSSRGGGCIHVVPIAASRRA